MNNLKKIIQELTDLQGNVGYEDQVIDYLLGQLDSLGEVSIDVIGNVTLHLTPNNFGKQKIVLFGHMDEVGMMVKRIDDEGFIYCEKLGSLNPSCLPGLKVQLQGDKGMVDGVIGVKSHHLAKAGEKKEITNAQDIYIDLGAKNRDSVLHAGIQIGTPVSYKPQFVELLDDCIANKAMDDRALLSILVYLAQNLTVEHLQVDLYLVFSVQEEFNTRGIMPTIRKIDPDIVLGLDVTPATDVPDLRGFSEITIGKGPALTYMNHHSRGTLAGIVPNKKLLEFLERYAQEVNVTIQREVATGILTETAYIAIENSHTVVANISLPTRYTHTPVEVINLKDAMGIYQLLKQFLESLDGLKAFGKNIDFERRG